MTIRFPAGLILSLLAVTSANLLWVSPALATMNQGVPSCSVSIGCPSGSGVPSVLCTCWSNDSSCWCGYSVSTVQCHSSTSGSFKDCSGGEVYWWIIYLP